MSHAKGISVKILGKEYQVICPAGQEHKLINAARCVDERMAEIRRAGRIIGLERIAVMAALNLADELLQKESSIQSICAHTQQLEQKLNRALTKSKSQRYLVSESTHDSETVS